MVSDALDLKDKTPQHPVETLDRTFIARLVRILQVHTNATFLQSVLNSNLQAVVGFDGLEHVKALVTEIPKQVFHCFDDNFCRVIL